jgi:RNase P/RNase MRP subunit POP5
VAQQVLIPVVCKDKEERKELREFCKDHFGRTFSAQCRYMLLKAKREAEAQEKAT